MQKEKIGLLVMAYGTPYKKADIEPYYRHIRHGRTPRPEAIQDLKDRYEAIGGSSPLARITNEQAAAITNELNGMQDNYEFELFIGLKHIHPFIEDAITEMGEKGIKKAISIVLAPHYSTFSVKSYNTRAKKAAASYGIELLSVRDWYNAEGFITFWAENIQNTYAGMTEEERNNAVLILSAHSLPQMILKDGDPYPSQLAETAELITKKAGITNYAVGWQSAGIAHAPWLGPDVQDLTRDLHAKNGYTTFVYTPVGFVSDHLEVLYDNDYECKTVCDELQASYYRPEMPNTNPLFIHTLAKVILEKAAEIQETAH